MNKIIILVYLMLLSVQFTLAQTEYEAVDDILNLYFQTIGQDRLLKTNTYVSKGKLIQGNAEIPFVSYNKRPLKYRLEAEIHGMKIITAFDGESGWTINPIEGISDPQQMTAEESERAKLQADYDGMFYDYDSKGYKVEFIDKDYVGFVEVYVLKLTTPDDDEITVYIDTENNVMLKSSSYVTMEDTVAEMEMLFTQHRFVDDILFPHSVETKVNGKTEMKMIVEQIDFDVDIPDSLFEMPETSDSEEENH